METWGTSGDTGSSLIGGSGGSHEMRSTNILSYLDLDGTPERLYLIQKVVEWIPDVWVRSIRYGLTGVKGSY